MDVSRSVRYRRTPRGAVLYTTQWFPAEVGGTAPTKDPKGAVLLLSGLNSYMSNNHDWLAGWLLKQGLAVFGYDHHAFGRSTDLEEFEVPATGVWDNFSRAIKRAACCFGRRAYVPNFQGLVHDAAFMVREVTAAVPSGVPIFLIGESMGGTIALEAARGLSGLPLHLILFAPMCSLGKTVAVHPAVECVGWVLSKVAPLLPTPLMKDTASLHAKSPERLREAKADPLRWQHAVRLGTAFQLKQAAAAAQARLALYNPSSLLVLHGSADLMCPLAGSLALLTQAPVKDKALVEYEGGLHALWAEPVETRRRLLRDVLAWVGGRAIGAGGGGGLAAHAPAGVDPSEDSGGQLAAPDLSRMAVLRAEGTFLHALRPEGKGEFVDSSAFSATRGFVAATGGAQAM
jgi:acylglycerol lipase